MDNLTNQSVAALLYMPTTSSQHSSILLAELVADCKKQAAISRLCLPQIYTSSVRCNNFCLLFASTEPMLLLSRWVS